MSGLKRMTPLTEVFKGILLTLFSFRGLVCESILLFGKELKKHTTYVSLKSNIIIILLIILL